MRSTESDEQLPDVVAIANLLQAWGLYRDTGRWDDLRSLYAPDAWMRTTWFEGPASDFVTASKRLSEKPKSLARVKNC